MRLPPNFRPNLRHLALMALGFVCTAALVQWVAVPRGWLLVDPLSSERRSELVLAYLQRPEPEDVLVIGSSRVGGGIDAPVLEEALGTALGEGSPVFKIGIPGLRPQLLARLLEGPVRARPPRRLLVLAIEARYFCEPRPIGEGRQLEGEWTAEQSLADRLDALDGLRAMWGMVWARDGQVRRRVGEIAARGGEELDAEQKARRLRLKEDRRARAADDAFLLPPGYEWVWGSEDGSAAQGWERCLDVLERLPCDVLLVRMPLVEGFDERHMPQMYARFVDEVVAGAAARGLDFVDLNRPPFPRDARDFLSLTHLDPGGAEETSRLLAGEVLAPRLGAR